MIDVLDPRGDMKQDGKDFSSEYPFQSFKASPPYRSIFIVSGEESPCSKIIGQIHAHAKLTSKWGGHVGTDRSIR